MAGTQNEVDEREPSFVYVPRVGRRDEEPASPTPPARGRSETRRPRKRRKRSRTRTRGSRESRARSRSSRSSSKSGRRARRPRRKSRKRPRGRREPSPQRASERRRRETVSVSSSCSSVDTSTSRHKRYASRGSIDKNNAFVKNVSLKDVMDLIKSLPSSTSQNHFSMNVNAVPEFDPACKEQTIDTWISKVEECSKLYQWSEIQLIHYALPKLGGVAKIWYQGLPSINNTWSEWKDKLTKTFPNVQDYSRLLHEMLDRKVKHNESLEAYFYHKTNLLNRCKIFGKDAVDCIIDGLEDRGMRLGAQAANYSEPEHILAYFKSIKMEDSKDKGTTYFKKPDDIQNDKAKPSSIRCFNCNEVGHPSFKCSKPLLTCTICKRLGHQSSNCRRLVNDNNDANQNREVAKAVSEG